MFLLQPSLLIALELPRPSKAVSSDCFWVSGIDWQRSCLWSLPLSSSQRLPSQWIESVIGLWFLKFLYMQPLLLRMSANESLALDRWGHDPDAPYVS